MKTFLLAVCLIASSLSSHADQENTTLVRRYDGKMVPVPVLGSAEAQLITPRKHPDIFRGSRHEPSILIHAILLIRESLIFLLFLPTSRM